MHADTFADRLHSLIGVRKLTASAIARQIGTTQQAVSKWLRGGNIEYKNLRALADVLHVDWLWLRYGDEALRDKDTPSLNLMDQRRRQYIQEIMDTQDRMLLALKASRVATMEWNPVTGELRNGVNVQELFGWDIHHETELFERVHPDDLSRLKETLCNITAAATVDPQHGSCDYRIVHPQSGETKWLVTRAQNFFDDDGHPVKMLTVSFDITDRKKAEEAAEQARSSMFQVLDSITDGCFALDDAWNLTYVNFQAEHLLRRSADEMLGRSLLSLFPEAQKFRDQYERARVNKLAVHFEEFYAPLDTWFEVHAYPRTGGLAVFFRDITAVKTTESTARQLTERLHLIEELSGIGLLEFTGQGGALTLSPQAAALIGVHPGELNTRDELNQRVIAEDRSFLKRAIEVAWRNKSTYECRYRIRLPDGTIRCFLEKGQLVINEQHLGGLMRGCILPLSAD